MGQTKAMFSEECFELLTEAEWKEECHRQQEYFNDKFGTGVHAILKYQEFLNKNK